MSKGELPVARSLVLWVGALTVVAKKRDTVQTESVG